MRNGSKSRRKAIVATVFVAVGVGLATPANTATAQPPAALVGEASEQADGRLATILEAHAADVGRLEARVRAARGKLLTETIDRLQKLQDEHCRAARLDEALAVREAIRRLVREADGVAASTAPPSAPAPPGPDSLTGLATKIGDTHLFTVTGANRGIIWGTDVYTIDSNLAAAAVHAGALASGETGVVKVTMLESQAEHVGTLRHGILSHRWPRYRMSFRVERVAPVLRVAPPEPPPAITFEASPVVPPVPALPEVERTRALAPSPYDPPPVPPSPGAQPPAEAGAAQPPSVERASSRRPFD